MKRLLHRGVIFFLIEIEKSKELELKLQEQEEHKEKSFEENLEQIIELLKNPLNIWNNDNIGLKKILISSLFEDKLMYSRDKGVRTSKLPSAYLPSLEIGENSEKRKKGDVRTSFYSNSELGLNALNDAFLEVVGDIGLEPMTPCL